jgi:hypothetical protein
MNSSILIQISWDKSVVLCLTKKRDEFYSVLRFTPIDCTEILIKEVHGISSVLITAKRRIVSIEQNYLQQYIFITFIPFICFKLQS